MIKEFKSGHWYRWTGPMKRQDEWSIHGGMDFILDGKPHQCDQGGGVSASFYDSPRDCKWTWSNVIEYFEELPCKYKSFENSFPDWWDGIPILCYVWDEVGRSNEAYVQAVNPDVFFKYFADGMWWKHSEPVIKTEPTEEYYLTRKVSGEVKGETRLTPEQIKELGVSDE